MTELIEALIFSKEAWEKAMNKKAIAFYCSEYIMKLIYDLCSHISDMDEEICLLFGCRVIVDTRLNEYDGYRWV